MRSLLNLLVCAILLPCIVLLAPVAASAGVVIRVPIDQPTIAAGLGAAVLGDTVLVACNTYYESGLSLPSGVTLMSAAYDSGCVVIDGGGTRASILTCTGISGAVVSGITFTNGSAAAGGAVECVSASVLFDYCFFTDNHATTTAGAMYWNGGTPEIIGCTFNGNTSDGTTGGLYLSTTGGSVTGCRFASNEAPWGAGAQAYGLGTTTAFIECEFSGNVSTYGGGVWVDSQAAPTFLHCNFYQNEGYYGAAATNYTKTTPVYTACEFNGNVSTYGGGAVFGHDDYAEFDSCEFTFNVVTDGFGGAMMLELSEASAEHCTFYMNTAIRAGAIECTVETSAALTSCTIVENTVTSGSAGLYLWLDSSVTIDKTIIAFNRGGAAVGCESGSTATLTCSDVSDNDGGDWVDCLAGQETSDGNMSTNPLHCNVPAYDLFLCADSPCLPGNNDCGQLIGAYDTGCGSCESPIELQSWGVIKAMFR